MLLDISFSASGGIFRDATTPPHRVRHDDSGRTATFRFDDFSRLRELKVGIPCSKTVRLLYDRPR